MASVKRQRNSRKSVSKVQQNSTNSVFRDQESSTTRVLRSSKNYVSKGQESSRKRSIEQVTPEFPSLPGETLEQVKEFAKKSQAALKSVQITLNRPSLLLPLISPNQLQSRFNVKQSTVFVVMRESYHNLKNELNSLNLGTHSGIYVRGPVGVGKSYLLYLLAAEYRLSRERYRVTYINDCASWRVDEFGYFFSELIMTFYDDKIEGHSIVELCQAVYDAGAERKHMMMMLMLYLVQYIHSKKLQWIVIFDQYNGLFNPPVFKNFPFSLIDYLSDNRRSNIKVIVSASPNSEGYPREMRGYKIHDLSGHRFEQEEFKVASITCLKVSKSTTNLKRLWMRFTGRVGFHMNWTFYGSNQEKI